MPTKVRNEIIYPALNFNGATVVVQEIDKWFHPILYNGCNYLSMLRLTLNHASKRSSRCHRIHTSLANLGNEATWVKWTGMFITLQDKVLSITSYIYEGHIICENRKKNYCPLRHGWRIVHNNVRSYIPNTPKKMYTTVVHTYQKVDRLLCLYLERERNKHYTVGIYNVSHTPGRYDNDVHIAVFVSLYDVYLWH